MAGVPANTPYKFGGSEVATPLSNYHCVELLTRPREIQTNGNLQENFRTLVLSIDEICKVACGSDYDFAIGNILEIFLFVFIKAIQKLLCRAVCECVFKMKIFRKMSENNAVLLLQLNRLCQQNRQ
jgi:hypothetical protein